jgi:hypothetical protein
MTTHTASNAMKMFLQITAMNVEKLLALIPRYEILKKKIPEKHFFFAGFVLQGEALARGLLPLQQVQDQLGGQAVWIQS